MKICFILLLLSSNFLLAFDADSLVKIKGDKYSGGLFEFNEPDYFRTLFPHSITDAISQRIASILYEGLLKFDPGDLCLKTSMAESYTVDASETVYTFKLRKGIFFHNNVCFPTGKGREFVAEDVRYCFTLLCTPGADNNGFASLDGILKGASEYYNAAKNGTPSFSVAGIKVIDSYTIQFTLTKPNTNFLQTLAGPFTYIFPKEAYDHYKDHHTVAVGTGAFILVDQLQGTIVVLKRNADYYRHDDFGNKLPYLNGLRIHFIREKKTEFHEFKEGRFDLVYRIPTDLIIELEMATTGGEPKYALQRSPELATHLLGFNVTSEVFKNVYLRKAISYAIDRQKILDAALKGEGYSHAIYGIVPQDGFVGYDVRKIRGYDLNVVMANTYLKKAGYKRGADVPPITLVLNSDGERNIYVAEEIKKQLYENLNINIEFEVITTKNLVTGCMAGKNAIFMVGWMADYPDPENFLWFLYGKNVPKETNAVSYPNLTRYSNSSFDKRYDAALMADTKEEKYEYLQKAEQIAMEDAPIVALWYEEGYRLIPLNVRGLANNPMQYRDFSEVYFIPK